MINELFMINHLKVAIAAIVAASSAPPGINTIPKCRSLGDRC